MRFKSSQDEEHVINAESWWGWKMHLIWLGIASNIDLLGKVMCAGLHLKDESLCHASLNVVMKQLPQPETVKMIEHFGFHKLKS
jgi:hypothetical protein